MKEHKTPVVEEIATLVNVNIRQPQQRGFVAQGRNSSCSKEEWGNE